VKLGHVLPVGLCVLAATTACSAGSSATVISTPKVPVLCQTWAPCMAKLADRLGAPVLAPPRSSSDRLGSTHLYGKHDVGYQLILHGVKPDVVGILGSTLTIAKLRSTAGGVPMTKTSVRGNAALDEHLPSGNVLIWREDGRTWRALFPSFVGSASAVEQDLRTFVTYQA
jgi:hypothetical protein